MNIAAEYLRIEDDHGRRQERTKVEWAALAEWFGEDYARRYFEIEDYFGEQMQADLALARSYSNACGTHGICRTLYCHRPAQAPYGYCEPCGPSFAE